MGDSVIATIAALSNFILVILILQVSRRAAPVEGPDGGSIAAVRFQEAYAALLVAQQSQRLQHRRRRQAGLSLSGGAAAAIAR